ncbi:MAG: universal stress protein, partial [Microlunatus sp.]|nr:universal stress protein [Microlunatus sp.]
ARYGVMGRYVVGSVGGALQHASGSALAFAPEGFAATEADHLERVSCGYSGSEDDVADLHTAVELCQRYDVPLRLITFVFPEYPMFQNRVDDRPARDREAARAAEQLRAVAASLPDGLQVQTLVARGGNVAQAMAQPDWKRGEVLVLASARLGPVARVFLGSTSGKLLRVCPVPVIVGPRG